MRQFLEMEARAGGAIDLGESVGDDDAIARRLRQEMAFPDLQLGTDRQRVDHDERIWLRRPTQPSELERWALLSA